MFSDPVKNIEHSGILPGMEIADFGAGSGVHTIAAAKALMSSGRVYAIDVQQDLLSKIKNSAVKAGLHNVEVIWGNVEEPNGSKLRENSIDLVMLSNVFFQIEKKEGVIKEIKRILKQGGKVSLVDWSDSFSGIGPKKNMVVTKEKSKEIFKKSGFHLDKEFKAGSHHYGLIFKKL